VSDTATAPQAPTLALHEPEWFAPLYALPRLEIVSGQGSYVKDAGGRKYLDFVSGIAVNALGHTPSGLSRAIGKQMKELGHCSNLFANRPGMELAKSLTEATGYDRVFFCNSGTEGVESALKFARARALAAGREGRDVLAFRGGFHGRTMFALATTWTPSYREPFEPLVPGVRFADFNSIAGLDAVLDEKVCAVIVEPVQGEGGGVPATKQFLQALRARTTALGAALVFDEVQCGMGRCGRLLASDHYGVKADYVVMSKALGGGLPLGAVLMTAEAAASLAPGMHGCTFGGGPVTSTARSNPRPRAPDRLGCFFTSPVSALSSVFARARTLDRKSGRFTRSSTNAPAVVATGLPPNVQPCMPGASEAAASAVISTAPSGSPPPSALLITT